MLKVKTILISNLYVPKLYEVILKYGAVFNVNISSYHVDLSVSIFNHILMSDESPRYFTVHY